MQKAQGKRRLQKENTREHILKTAMSTYAARGFSVSTHVIAQEAGIAHGSVFAHFPTRDALLLHTLKRFAEELGEKLHNLSLAEEDVRALLYAHIGILKEYEAFYTHLICELSSLPPEARETLISIHSVASHHFSQAIGKAAVAGAIKDIPLHMLFNTWIALLHYYLGNKNLFAPEASVLDRYQHDLVSAYLALIQK